jgi:hypothetical protein
LLVERGARLDIPDTIYSGTPLDWAVYGERAEIAEYLRSRPLATRGSETEAAGGGSRN